MDTTNEIDTTDLVNAMTDIGVNSQILKQIMNLADNTLLSLSTKHFTSSQPYEKPKVTKQQLVDELKKNSDEFRHKYYSELKHYENNGALFELTREFYRDVLVPEFKLKQVNIINSVTIIDNE
jgi:hypothetical protein